MLCPASLRGQETAPAHKGDEKDKAQETSGASFNLVPHTAHASGIFLIGPVLRGKPLGSSFTSVPAASRPF
jgi:hypothetical protein